MFRRVGDYCLNLSYLNYFIKLAHIQHYTKAAEQLCITQPSLSHAISQLESELGVPLFEKNGRNTTLTRFGEEFLLCAENTLSTLDAGILSLQQSARGEGVIRLGLLRTLGVEFIPRLAAQFLAANPEKDIRFTFHTGTTQQLLNGLAARKYDLAFCSQPPSKLNFTSSPISKQDLVLIVPKDHPLATQHSVELSETLPYPHIYFSEESGLRRVIDNLFAQIGVEPRIAYETEEDQVIAGLVAQGFGISVVPYIDLLLKLDLKILQINSSVLERNLFMVHDDKTFIPPVVRHFRQFVLDNSDL